MKCGYHKEVAVKNVCAVGLSAGFVEPLEATGITFTTAVVSDLAGVLNASGNVWGEQQKAVINRNFSFMSHEILAFVWAHYYFSTKSDTEYWNSFRTKDISELPETSQEILNLFLPVPKRFLNIAPNSMFNVVQWFTVLHAGGAYSSVQTSLTDKQQRYAEYFLECHNKRLELAEEMFNNHYDYLTDWYSQ
jgi:tryptophan halogenase